MKKIAIFFPGIGYTVDKPLLHYGRRLAASLGYDIRLLPYGGFPKKVKGDKSKMAEAYEMALKQSKEMMADLDLKEYGEILFIGKSVGTMVAVAVASEREEKEKIRLVLYTPVEETFSFPFREAVVFTGSADPWVGGAESRIPALARERGVPCYVFPNADHSLETGDVWKDLDNMKEIMEKTKEFILNEKK